MGRAAPGPPGEVVGPPTSPKLLRTLWEAGLLRPSELPDLGVVLIEGGYGTPGLLKLMSFVNRASDPGVTEAAERALAELGAPSLDDRELAGLAPALLAVCVSAGWVTTRAALDFISAFVPEMDYPDEPPDLLRLFGWADDWGASFSPYPGQEVHRNVREAWEGVRHAAGIAEWRPDGTATRLLSFVLRS